MTRFLRNIYWSLGLLLVLAIAVVAGGYFWARSSLPDYGGKVAVAGLADTVEVLRDGDGLVTIRAESDLDAYRALGFVHAQDRLWQMDMTRRTGAGRLSEVIGSATLRVDRVMRTLGLYRVAEANLAALSAPVRESFEAYSEGVNAFLTQRSGPLPPEFLLLRYEPEPWTPVDSLVWGRLMALQLSGNWRTELLRARLAKTLSPEELQVLWPPYPRNAPITGVENQDQASLPPEDLPQSLLKDSLASLPWSLAPKDASNAWALSGALTASGKPILANDPHLGLEAPGVWYLARIETPGLTLSGATAPGVPFHLVGHNGAIAWGLTTTHSDTQDLFIEEVSPEDSGRYRTPEGWAAFETRSETIAVKDEEPVELMIRHSRHGPVISDGGNPSIPNLGEGRVLALAWPALREDDLTAQALYHLNRAQDWVQFEDALRDFHSPQQNIFFADVNGNIGFIAPGRAPIRKNGDGRRPVPGWDGAYDWTGFIPFDELPRSLNPRPGRIANGNNKIVPEAYPYLITADWPDPYRAQRLAQVLTGLDRAKLDDMQAMQHDIVSLGLKALLPHLTAIEPVTEDERKILELLAAWDHRMDRDRPEPLIAYGWIYALNARILADDLGADFPYFQKASPRLLLSVLTDHPGWCDDRGTAEVEDCATQISAALVDALTDLEQVHGSDVADWRWGDAHRAAFPHPVFSRVPLYETLFGFTLETNGGDDTVNRAGTSFSRDPERRFADRHGPGFRGIYDLADLEASQFIIATGQSGHPLSAHYGDLAKRWRDGHYVALTGKNEIRHRLLLVPEGTGG